MENFKLSNSEIKHLLRILREKKDYYDENLIESNDELSRAHQYNDTIGIMECNETIDELKATIDLNEQLINKFSK